jgi:hypothetical protein
MHTQTVSLLLLGCLLAAACGDDDGAPSGTDAGPRSDASMASDAGTATDADATDAGATDAGLTDGGSAMGPLVYLNHGYRVLPEALYQAVQENEYLATEFVDVEVRTTVRPDITYTGTYLNMQHTYYEFFGAETLDAPVGLTALALGVERPGDLELLAADWTDAFGAALVPEIDLVSRTIGDDTVPWFRIAYPDIFNYDHTDMWVMEYVPNDGASVPRTREEERSVRYDPSKLARNIETQLVAFPSEDTMAVTQALSAAGWTTTAIDGGYRVASPDDHGTRRQVMLVADGEGRLGLLGLRIALNRMATHTEPVGEGCVLEVGVGDEPIANLWFTTPTENDRTLLNSSAE